MAKLKTSDVIKGALGNQGVPAVPSEKEIEHALKATPKLPGDIARALARQMSPMDRVRLFNRQKEPGYEWPIAASRGGGSKKK